MGRVVEFFFFEFFFKKGSENKTASACFHAFSFYTTTSPLSPPPFETVVLNASQSPRSDEIVVTRTALGRILGVPILSFAYDRASFEVTTPCAGKGSVTIESVNGMQVALSSKRPGFIKALMALGGFTRGASAVWGRVPVNGAINRLRTLDEAGHHVQPVCVGRRTVAAPARGAAAPAPGVPSSPRALPGGGATASDAQPAPRRTQRAAAAGTTVCALGGARPLPGWPPHGGIEFDSVTATYRDPLPHVLVNVSLIIPPGSSIGICGRTGSGKSSLLLALFRLIPITPSVGSLLFLCMTK